jgi:hypothetical protein
MDAICKESCCHIWERRSMKPKLPWVTTCVSSFGLTAATYICCKIIHYTDVLYPSYSQLKDPYQKSVEILHDIVD